LKIKTTTAILYMPKDREFLAAIGTLALRHEQMNYVLRLTIKSLTGLSIDEIMRETKRNSSKELRAKVRKNSKERPGLGDHSLKLQIALAECEILTTERNELIHGVCTKKPDGAVQIRDSVGTTRQIPSAKNIISLSRKIEKLTAHLDKIRRKIK
jgi:hypothetical protein